MSSLASILEAVTVYREGAVCLRRARVETSPSRQVRLGGLPLSLEPGSLRAWTASGGLRVLDVQPQLDAALAGEVDVPAERRALEAAQDALARLEARRSRLVGEIEELQNLVPRFPERKRGEPPRAAPVAAVLALTDFTESELARRLEQRQGLEEEIAAAREELELRGRRVQEASTALRGERTRLSRAAVVTLSAPPVEPFDLSLEYRVPGARWAPSYQLQLERGMTGGALRMRASVAQQTGEDWQGVALALSTASLSRRTDLPELKALKIGRRQEAAPRSGWREPPPGLDELFEPYDSAMALAPAAGAEPQGAAKGGPGEGRRAKRAKDRRRQEALGAAVVVPEPPISMPCAAPAAAPPELLAEPAPEMPAMEAERSVQPLAKMARAFAGPMKRGRREAGAEDLAEAASAEAGAPPPSPPPPERALDRALMDYDRLVLIGAGGGAARGLLRPAPSFELAFFAGVSVQIDVAMAFVASAQREAAAVGSLPLPARCEPANAVDSFDYRYECTARADVPSSGKWTTVPVTTCAVRLAPGYVCVPAVEPKVYRVLQIANPSSHAMLPGPVDVTAGGDFLMTTRLPPIPPSAEAAHPLGLGVEEAVKVARRTRFKEATGGILGGSTVLTHEIEIDVDNRLASPASIEVRERVPWVDPGEEKDVTVEEGRARPPWEKVDEPIEGAVVRGARRWRVTVPPGQRSRLEAQFTIRMPSDRMVVGGNRRV